jgi:hypothetical protein
VIATSTLTPVADSYVDASAATTNYGTSTQLRIDASPVVRSYLRFDLTGLTGTVTSATLRIWANSAQSTGYDAYSVADTTWGETTITNANAPAFGVKVGSSGALIASSWSSVNVTSAVATGGLISFGISTTNSTAASLSSRTGANPPQLVVTTSSGAAFAPPPPGGPGYLLPLLLVLVPVLAPALLLLSKPPVRRAGTGTWRRAPDPALVALARAVARRSSASSHEVARA